jgi:hypothetical protein
MLDLNIDLLFIEKVRKYLIQISNNWRLDLIDLVLYVLYSLSF